VTDPLDALIEAVRLKRVARAGWVRVGVPDPESVAAHSWGVAWLAVVLAPPELDRARVLTYAVLHDLAEAWVGDLTPHDGVSREDKERRERVAVTDLCARIPRGAEVLAAWEAYEAQADDEARFVRQLDRLDMAVQAAAYADQAPTAEFVASAAAVVTDPALRPLLDATARRTGRTPS
jgi:putative hydrolase of HD superfamily